MDEAREKKVDESWKERAEREKRPTSPEEKTPHEPSPSPQPSTEQPPEARFDVFVSGLAVEALIALGDMPHPTTRKQAANLPQARYLIDLIGVLEEKTKGNITPDEERLLKDTLYQLRMRYLAKAER